MNVSNGLRVQFDLPISLTETMNAILSDTSGRSSSGYYDGSTILELTSSYIIANLEWELPSQGYVRLFVIGK